MRILLHTDDYHLGGSPNSKRMRVFAEELIRAGHSVIVLTSSQSRKKWDPKGRMEKVVFCPTFPLLNKSSIVRTLNQLSFGISSFIRSAFIRNIDVVINTSPPPLVSPFGLLIAKAKNAKLVYDVRDIWPDVAIEMDSFSTESIYYRIFNWIKLKMLKSADLVTAVSPTKVTKLAAYLPETERSKVRFIGNGLDISFLSLPINDDIMNKYSLREKTTIVYIGNIGLAQNLDALLDLALEHINDSTIQFLLFGTGAELDRLKDRVNREKLHNVKLEGHLNYDSILTVLKYSSISYVPLKNSKMKDSIPTKIYESLGAGCPVLLLAEGDSVEILNETKLGRALSPDNVNDLPSVFNEMLQNYESILENKDNAMEVIRKNYSRQKYSKDLVDILEQSFN